MVREHIIIWDLAGPEHVCWYNIDSETRGDYFAAYADREQPIGWVSSDNRREGSED